MNELTGPVQIIGTGLLGTSIGLALRAAGVPVWLSDANPEHLRTAVSLGAGEHPPSGGVPQLVVVAVPPLTIAEVVLDALETGAVVTDIGSVKALPLDQVSDQAPESALARYVGSHPMAGSERSGPLAASAALFEGRPWAVTPHVHADPAAVALVEALVRSCGATPVRLSPVEHDLAVARTSHLPHLLAVLAAAQLTDAVPEHLTLSGQGVRDVTRVAGGDPHLYGQIIRANRTTVGDLLRDVRRQLDELIHAVDEPSADTLVEILNRGVAGTQVIPGKHGGPSLETGAVYVLVPDHPGELARLFTDIGEIGVNVEDLHIDHDPARPAGLVELVVESGAAERLRAALGERGWTTHR
ncbi:prephenate dehydrogenase [Nocardioides pocheonensis]|uniref:Prephenate dehydrogenase n=1 Tax=Nocardioides pocheonensis TaxID=661485 RepID=A0A3N0GF51_9ACTN|nr:prephenate dehydrogenase [Nocardioides pocheonensis]RNM11087.1 prephenate dehydrogenase [Nocardioides pocheonensis]